MEFANACRCVGLYAISGHGGSPLFAVSVLRAALVKLRPTVNHLTPAHVEFVKLCVFAHAHHRALAIVDDNLFNVDMESGITVEDVLLYAYYAGMAYCGARKFVKARDMFLRCMSTPATSVSAIAIEAYKKFVLVSLIIDGKVAHAALVDAVPRSLSAVLGRTAEAYQELAQTSSSKGVTRSGQYGKAPAGATADDLASGKKRRGDEVGEPAAGAASSSTATSTGAAAATPSSTIDRIALRHIDRLRADGNLGLLKQAVAAEQRINVKRQTKTYLTMSLAAIAQRAGLPNAAAAEDLLLQMIEAGEIFAKISARDGMVVFQDVGDALSGAEQLAHMNGLIDKVMQLGRNVRDLEHELQLDPALIKKQLVSANAEASFAATTAALSGGSGTASLLMALDN